MMSMRRGEAKAREVLSAPRLELGLVQEFETKIVPSRVR